MKRILHIFRTSQFTEGFVNAINKYSNAQRHIFMIYTGEINTDDEYLYQDNVIYVQSIGLELKKPSMGNWLNSFDKIIYHGFFDWDVIYYFSDKENLLNKLYIYFWGGDIPLFGNEDAKIIKKKVINKARGILTVIDSDYKKIINLYNPVGIHMSMMYCDDVQIELMRKYIIPNLADKKEKIYIQIGNSATYTNEHIMVLDLLKKYKNENICIILPLAYGDKEYAKEVVEYGIKIFGEKVVILYDYLPLEDYIKQCLLKVDIGIFAIDRQQALGNIHILGANGSKIFLKKDSQLDEYMTKIIECEVFYVEDIEKMSFSDFIYMPLKIKQKNSHNIFEAVQTKKRIEKWNELFKL